MKRLDRFAGVTAQRPTAYTIPDEGQFHQYLAARQVGMLALPDWHLPRSMRAS